MHETSLQSAPRANGGPGRHDAVGVCGFTLVEVSLIVLVLTILSAITLPQLGSFNRLARFSMAREDLTGLCAAADVLIASVFQSNFWDDPAGDSWGVSPTGPVGLLWGPGRIPSEGIAPNGAAAHNITGDGWYEDNFMDPCFTARPDDGGAPVDFFCDPAVWHLIEGISASGWPYPNPLDDPRPPGTTSRDIVGTFLGWRGPYLAAIRKDPWGNRYMINVFALYGGGGLFTAPVFCYSAGADGRVDTAFNQPMTSAFTIGRDDLAVIMSAGGTF